MFSGVLFFTLKMFLKNPFWIVVTFFYPIQVRICKWRIPSITHNCLYCRIPNFCEFGECGNNCENHMLANTFVYHFNTINSSFWQFSKYISSQKIPILQYTILIILSDNITSNLSQCSCPLANYTGGECWPGTFCPSGSSYPTCKLPCFILSLEYYFL